MDIIIKNGKIVFPDQTIESTIAINEGKIVAIGSNTIMPKGEKVIDARGKFILPGGIDPHDHTGLPSTSEDWFQGTKATSWGGTTTLINFIKFGMNGIKKLRNEIDNKVAIDYSVHAIIGNIIPETIETIKEIKKLIDYGVPSFKLFMALESPVDDNTIFKVFQECKTQKGLPCLHAENNSIIEYNRAEAIKKGNRDAIFHALTRPPITEAEAVNMAIYLSSSLSVPYMNMHISTREGVDLLRNARKKGKFAYGETCTHYLCRTKEDLLGSRGIYYICIPPLRTREHIEAMWEGINDGTLSIVSSDHCGFTTEMKMGHNDFTQVPNGLPGHEFRLPLLFSEGLLKRHISINRLSTIFSTNSAKIYGLYPKKGVINVGSDADIVILDPKLERTITTDMLMGDIDWSPFEGMKVKGWPIYTISKGKVIWENGEFLGKQGDGKFLKRKLQLDLFEHQII